MPLIVQSPTFGALVLDRSLGEYEGRAQWCGDVVPLSLFCQDISNLAMAMSVAESIFSTQEDWAKRAKDFAAESLLELKNDNWLEDDEKKLSREDFISLMKVQSISVNESGDLNIWYEDSELFWGPAILVSGNLERGLTDAGIHG